MLRDAMLQVPPHARAPETPACRPARGAVERPSRRVGLVIGQLTAGGAEGQLALLCAALDRAAVTPIVYCLSTRCEPYGPRIAATGTTVRYANGGRLQRIRWLRRWLAADGVAVVHAWLFIANAYAWAANWGARRPLVTSARNCKVQGRLSRMVNRRAFRASRAIVVNSADVGAYVVRHYGAPRARIQVVPNAIDVQRFHPAAEPPGTAPALIVTVGRLVEQKNHALFLEAAARLASEFAQVRFVIVGDGPLRSALAERARALGVADRVTFAGERHDVEAILRGAALFWLTSRWEGMPNVLLEAMASGVPPIATDVGGVRELVRSGVDGFVVAAGDAAGFVEHSRALLQDSALRRACRSAARARAEEFAVAAMAGALVRLYDRVAAG
jgi:glycosyltransferase involved in cell wall biosynthesis